MWGAKAHFLQVRGETGRLIYGLAALWGIAQESSLCRHWEK